MSSLQDTRQQSPVAQQIGIQIRNCGKAGSTFEPCMVGMQNLGLELQYKTCYARVLDSKRKFLQAATQYYELSQVENVRSGPGQVSTNSPTC